MRAISSFSLEAGTSTFWCRARIALRMRVSMSATGSVNLIVCFSSAARLLRPECLAPRTRGDAFYLNCYPASIRPDRCSPLRVVAQGGRFIPSPGRLRNPGNLSPQRQAAETQAANAELAQIRARTSAHLAAVMLARGKLRLRLFASRIVKLLLDLCVLDSFCCSQLTFRS